MKKFLVVCALMLGLAPISKAAQRAVFESTTTPPTIQNVNVAVSTLTTPVVFTPRNYLLFTSSDGRILSISSSVFHTGYYYLGIGTTSPIHIFETYENWGGDNSSRWVLVNTGTGYGNIETRNDITGASSKLTASGSGPSDSWFTGYPASNSAGTVISGNGVPGVYYVQTSSLAIGTGSGGGPIDMFVNTSKVFTLTSTSAVIPSSTNFPGLILQSTQTMMTTSSATTSSTFVRSGLKVTISPRFTTSQVEVHASFTFKSSSMTADTCFYTLERNGTNLALPGDHFGTLGSASGAGIVLDVPVSIAGYRDGPVSTSAQTYEIYIRNTAGLNTCTLNNNGVSFLKANELAF